MKPSTIRLFAASALLSMGAILSVSAPMLAAGCPCPSGSSCVNNACVVDAATSTSTTTTSTPTKLTNPLGDEKMNLNQFIGRLINAALGLSGAIALLMFVWGGVQMLVSGGKKEMISSGKSTLTWAAIGIVVIFTSYTLVNVLINALAGG